MGNGYPVSTFQAFFFVIFVDTKMVLETGESANVHKSNQRLRNKIQDLQEENNLLRLKYEILLNMVYIIVFSLQLF